MGVIQTLLHMFWSQSLCLKNYVEFERHIIFNNRDLNQTEITHTKNEFDEFYPGWIPKISKIKMDAYL